MAGHGAILPGCVNSSGSLGLMSMHNCAWLPTAVIKAGATEIAAGDNRADKESKEGLKNAMYC